MQKYFFIKTDGRYIKINFTDMILVEGCRNYCKIVTENKSYLVLITLKRMEHFLPASLFCRIHKSFIVSLDRIVEFNTDTIYLKDKQMPIGQQYKSELHKSVTIINDTTEIMKPGISFPAVTKNKQHRAVQEIF